jgi:hypothetical protein
MLSNTLVTNEVKNAAGTEVEFTRFSMGPGRETVYHQSGESPSSSHTITIKHSETGTGINLRRRSMVRVDKTVPSTVDATKTVVVSDYWVQDAPVGALTASTEMANVMAELMSFMSSLGASTTILYDCTGNGAATLLAGSL